MLELEYDAGIDISRLESMSYVLSLAGNIAQIYNKERSLSNAERFTRPRPTYIYDLSSYLTIPPPDKEAAIYLIDSKSDLKHVQYPGDAISRIPIGLSDNWICFERCGISK